LVAAIVGLKQSCMSMISYVVALLYTGKRASQKDLIHGLSCVFGLDNN